MAITKLVIHHSASAKATTTKAMVEKWHTDKGYSKIGYHKFITGTGAIKDGRSESTIGAHAQGANSGSLGVCVAGNFETETPSATQIDALVKVLKKWCKDHSLTSSKIYGHYNVPGGTTTTSCPGKNLKSKITSIKTKVDAGSSS